jgi:hypothetical protein
MRKVYIWLKGAFREKTGDSAAIVDGEMWHNFGGTWGPLDGTIHGTPPMIMGDIAPYRSVITGEVIGSRSTHRAHLREHNCIEVGNERLPPPKKEWTASKGLREELIARFNR